MNKENEKRSWYYILAGIILIVGLIFPFASEIHHFRKLNIFIGWYVFTAIMTACAVSAARTQDRLARVEHKLGLDKDSNDQVQPSKIQNSGNDPRQ
jgi:pheromone shutdown protein TraB